jgi:exopolyphosphatase / guanosine-5'-triphosphate,3'-diphosphate pyrophosphatase
MRAATVDLGTNSVLLLCADVNPDLPGSARILDERCRITRLGEGLDRPGKPLTPAAVQRTLQAIGEYGAVMQQLGVERRAAIGTAALRDAGQSDPFRAEAEKLLGCPLEIISGQREAALALAGVRGAFGELPAGTLLFDPGGGSTELTLVGDAGSESISLPLGAVRLSERHLHSDPPRAEELAAVRAEVRQRLAALPGDFERPVQLQMLVGLAGTVTTLATVELGLADYDTEKVNGLWLGRDQLAEQLRRYAALPLEERARIAGLEPARADVILGGALIVEGLLERFDGDQFRVCDRGVRWGRLWELVAAP